MLESKKEFERIFNLLKRKENFSLSRYGDGELGIIANCNIPTTKDGSNGFSFYSEKSSLFRESLIESITHKQNNYIKGISCGCCWTHIDLVKIGLRLVPGEDKTLANVFMNGNSKRFPEILNIIKTRNVVLTCNWNAAAIQNPRLNLNIRYCFRSKGNCINNLYLVDEISKFIEDNNVNNFVFLFCVGPLSNILCHRLYKKFPNNTYLDIGSVFDPIFYGKTTRWYHDYKNPMSKKFCTLKYSYEVK